MSYLYLAGIPKEQITAEKIDQLLALVHSDNRVITIEKTENPIQFYIEAKEIESGVYSFGRICNHLNELPSERKARLEKEVLPDIINITKFIKYADRGDQQIRNLPKYTRECLHKAIIECPASSEKAQLINTLGFKLYGNESIADRILRDHVSIGHAKRHAQLLVNAGCANSINNRIGYYGKILFEDGSSL